MRQTATRRELLYLAGAPFLRAAQSAAADSIRKRMPADVPPGVPLIIAKSTLPSRVHRRVQCDYIGVKKYDDEGRVNGEVRFLGLFGQGIALIFV